MVCLSESFLSEIPEKASESFLSEVFLPKVFCPKVFYFNVPPGERDSNSNFQIKRNLLSLAGNHLDRCHCKNKNLHKKTNKLEFVSYVTWLTCGFMSIKYTSPKTIRNRSALVFALGRSGLI